MTCPSKILCKKNCFSSDNLQLLTANFWYAVIEIERVIDGEYFIIRPDGRTIETMWILARDLYLHEHDKRWKFEDYFYSEKELRKLKLEKINDTFK